MESREFLDLRKSDTIDIIRTVSQDLDGLDTIIFNTKPSQEKWSVSECFQHLNLTLNIYIPQMAALVKQKEKYPKHTDIFNYSIIGKMAVKSMTPKPDNTIPFKMKTFANLKPLLSKGHKSKILNEFIAYQQSTLEIIEGLRDMNLTKPKIITAAGSLVKMRIGDALHFMVAHNQRHIVQVQHVLKIIT